MNRDLVSALAQGDQTKVVLIGKQEFMGKEIPVIIGGFGEDNKVVTDKMIAEIHNITTSDVRKAINRNIKRFKENIDVIDLKSSSSGDDLIIQLGYSKQQALQAEHIYILSERGYSKLIKIMDTDLAWEIHDKLIDDYFTLREKVKKQVNPLAGLSKELQAIFAIDTKQQEHDARLTKLENNMTLDHGQQLIIQQLVNRRGTEVLGGKTTMAYKLLSKKTFQEVYRALKNSFQVPSYRDIPVKRFEEAKEMVIKWTPSQELQLMIIGANAQVSLEA